MTPLIDLHTDWILQYAGETTVYDSSCYDGIAKRFGQAEGYLQTVRAAVLSCFRRAEDWAKRSDPWAALDELITRIEAEFSGRLLIGREDFDRWEAERDTLTWGLIGVEGFDALIRSEADLERLPRLFHRGVRVFQPVYNASSLLGGSSIEGDDRGLTPLGTKFLETLAGLGEAPGPRPAVDLAHMNPKCCSDVLAWFEADVAKVGRLLPIYSHGGITHAGFDTPRALSLENLARLRAMGGVVGIGVTPPFYYDVEQIVQAVETVASYPRLGEQGYLGIAIGTDFLGVERVNPGLENAPKLVSRLEKAFPRPVARRLLYENGKDLIRELVGARRV